MHLQECSERKGTAEGFVRELAVLRLAYDGVLVRPGYQPEEASPWTVEECRAQEEMGGTARRREVSPGGSCRVLIDVLVEIRSLRRETPFQKNRGG